MQLVLEKIQMSVDGLVHLHPLDLTLAPNTVTVLLGATQAGKTTLMRLMAGLDAPTGGRVLVDGVNVTGQPVRQRNVSMVYQQFINYPSLTVEQNIASPLKLRGESNITKRVQELAETLHIEQFLKRLPAELSGGQQQRVALARALAKKAPLMLLDEPLVNLDYKLREGLREELLRLFASGESTVVYATTEPTEALLLGGYTAVLDQGEVLSYGRTAEVFHRPDSIRVAQTFSDPPMNLMAGHATAAGVQLSGGLLLAINALEYANQNVTVGVRAIAMHLAARPGDVMLNGRIELSEISGSDTFIYFASEVGELVAQLSGVHELSIDTTLPFFISPEDVFVFGSNGDLLRAPSREGY